MREKIRTELRRNKSIYTLMLVSFLFLFLLTGRLAYAQTTQKVFLAWNLFLAWVPVLVLLPIKRKTPTVFKVILFILWFIFLPNALYTITDLKHIGVSSNFILYWLDIFLLFGVATLGTWLALVSLEQGETKIKELYGRKTARIMRIVVIIISGFGVYLGRFPRLNSWHIFTDPISVSKVIAESTVSMFTNYYYLFFVCLFSGFYWALYTVYTRYKKI